MCTVSPTCDVAPEELPHTPVHPAGVELIAFFDVQDTLYRLFVESTGANYLYAIQSSGLALVDEHDDRRIGANPLQTNRREQITLSDIRLLNTAQDSLVRAPVPTDSVHQPPDGPIRNRSIAFYFHVGHPQQDDRPDQQDRCKQGRRGNV
jgi:hypothetical protein